MRKIWLTRHGQSMSNVFELLGGDSHLSPLGQVYAQKLPDMLIDRVPLVSFGRELEVGSAQQWTKSFSRADVQGQSCLHATCQATLSRLPALHSSCTLPGSSALHGVCVQLRAPPLTSDLGPVRDCRHRRAARCRCRCGRPPCSAPFRPPSSCRSPSCGGRQASTAACLIDGRLLSLPQPFMNSIRYLQAKHWHDCLHMQRAMASTLHPCAGVGRDPGGRV
jgi:hypothetical protein